MFDKKMLKVDMINNDSTDYFYSIIVNFVEYMAIFLFKMFFITYFDNVQYYINNSINNKL